MKRHEITGAAYNGLPVPRLELRWVKSDEAQGWENRKCIYEIVLPLREWDIRREDDLPGSMRERQARNCLRVEIGQTDVNGGGVPIHNGRVDSPFRDGAHALWDAEALNLPLWATCDGNATKLK